MPGDISLLLFHGRYRVTRTRAPSGDKSCAHARQHYLSVAGCECVLSGSVHAIGSIMQIMLRIERRRM